MFRLLVVTLMLSTCHSFDQFEGESTYVDDDGTIRTNDPMWHCGRVNEFGQFIQDPIEMNHILRKPGESCRRACNDDSDCDRGQFCWDVTDNDPKDYTISQHIKGKICLCNQHDTTNYQGCGKPGLICLAQHGRDYRQLDQRCVCDPNYFNENALRNTCGRNNEGVCQDVKYGWKWFDARQANNWIHRPAGVCKQICNTIGSTHRNGKMCTQITNVPGYSVSNMFAYRTGTN